MTGFGGRWVTLAAILLYVLSALSLTWLARFQLNPDGIAYIQVAHHWAHGQLDLSVNSYWGPLLSWLLVPLLWLNVDPVLASKLLNVGFGLGFALGVSAVVKELTGGAGSRVALVGGLLLALIMLPEPITPDLLLAFLLTWYFAHAMKLFRSDSPMRAAGVGLLGGVAYLAKAYALPFVVLHLTMTMLLKLRLAKHGTIAAGLKQYAASLATLAIVALPWVGAISLHDNQFTIGSAGKYWSAWSPLPAHKPRSPERAIQLPREGRLGIWENPVEIRLSWPLWSASDGFTGLRYELITIIQNLGLLDEYLSSADVLGLLAVSLIFAVIFLFPLRETLKIHDGILRFWCCLSVVIFVGGYVLVLLLDRYLWPTWGMLLALAIAGPAFPGLRDFEVGRARADEGVMGRSLALWHRLLVFVLVASIAMNVGRTFYLWSGPGGRHVVTATWKDVGKRFTPGCRFAANDYASGLYVTYWARGVYLGELSGRTPEAIARELAPFAGVTVLVFNDPALSAALAASHIFIRLDVESRAAATFSSGGDACPRAPRVIGP